MVNLLTVPGAFNVRDLGGILGRDNRKIIDHKLIRAGYLSDINETGNQNLLNYGVKTIIDLRSPDEVTTYPDKISSEFNYLKVPIFPDDVTASTSTLDEINTRYARDSEYGYERMLQSYRRMVIDPHAICGYHAFFQAILDHRADGGILFHCSAGKDRTGICSYLLLAVLGVNPQRNLQDYLDSNPASKDRINSRMQEAKNRQLGQCFVTSIHDLAVVSLDYIEQPLSLINYEFGGMTAFIKDEIELSDSDINAICDAFLK